MSKHVVIIPAAGLASRLRPLSNMTSKAMVSVNGKPTIAYIIDQIKEWSDDIRIVYGKSDDIVNYCKRAYPDLPITFHNQEEPRGPLHAIHCALLECESIDAKVTVWLGDTIVLDYKPSGQDEVVYGNVGDWERWCLIDNLGVLHDKPKTDPYTRKALVGIYSFSQMYKFYSLCDNIIDYEDPSIGGEYQISQLLKHYNLKQIETKEWYDCGDFPSLYQSRARLINRLSREDNELSVDVVSGTITKTGARCKNEIEWYKQVPLHIKPFVPSVYSYTEDSYTMEYCPGTSVQDILVYEAIKDDTLEYILGRVLNVFDLCFVNTDNIVVDKGPCFSDSYYMWVLKNAERIDRYNYDFVSTSDKVFMIDRIHRTIHVPFHTPLKFIHGDLHLGNILFDFNTGKIKMLDPRGSWANKITARGDVEYDLAKLYQSCYCEYMWIVNNVPTDHVLKEKMVKILDSHFSDYNIKLIKTMACIMMASCLPFHSDNPNRQKRIWSTAVNLLKELI